MGRAISAAIEQYCQTAHEDFQEFKKGQKRLIDDVQDVHGDVKDLQREAKRQKTTQEGNEFLLKLQKLAI